MKFFFRFDNFESLLPHETYPNLSVPWAVSGIVQGLRDAEAELAAGDWTSLDSAVEWMRRYDFEQVPRRYGCSSWYQVLRASKQFDVFIHVSASSPGPQNAPCLKIWYRSCRQPL